MASYTMRVQTMIEQATQYRNDLTFKNKLAAGVEAFFKDIEYPIFSESYRKTFEENFVRHFYMREIGFETEFLFKFHLESWLKLNMPYYNKLFESELMEFEPFTNVDMYVDETVDTDSEDNSTVNTTETRSNTYENDSTTDNTSNITGTSNTTVSSNTTDTSNTTGSSTDTGETFNRDLHTDTPDNRLAITTQDGAGVIEYASSIDESKSNSNTTNTNETDSTSSTNTSTENDTSTQNDTTSESITKQTGLSNDDILNDMTGNNTNETKKVLANHRHGKEGTQTYMSMLQELRATYLNIEKQIFNEMNKELFMLLY